MRTKIKLLVLVVTLFGFIVVPAAARPSEIIDPDPPPPPITWYDYEPFDAYAIGGLAGDTSSSSVDGYAQGGRTQWLDLRFPLGHQFELGVSTAEFVLVTNDHISRRGRISFDMSISYSIYSLPNVWKLPWGDIIILGYGSAQIKIELIQYEHSYTSSHGTVIYTLAEATVENGAGKSDYLEFNLDRTFVTGYMAPVIANYNWKVRVTMSHTNFAGCYAMIDMDIAKLQIYL